MLDAALSGLYTGRLDVQHAKPASFLEAAAFLTMGPGPCLVPRVPRWGVHWMWDAAQDPGGTPGCQLLL